MKLIDYAGLQDAARSHERHSPRTVRQPDPYYTGIMVAIILILVAWVLQYSIRVIGWRMTALGAGVMAVFVATLAAALYFCCDRRRP